jgi:hypothetical protein
MNIFNKVVSNEFRASHGGGVGGVGFLDVFVGAGDCVKRGKRWV